MNKKLVPICSVGQSLLCTYHLMIFDGWYVIVSQLIYAEFHLNCYRSVLFAVSHCSLS